MMSNVGLMVTFYFTIAVSAAVRHACYERESCLLPCQSKRRDVDVEWMLQTDQGEKMVHFKGDGHDNLQTQYAPFKGRTALDLKQMKNGNMSLVLRDVKKTDEGNYTCYILPGKDKASEVQLLVVPTNRSTPLTDQDFAQVSPPEVSIEGYGTAGGVLLQCESGGWPAEPELEWRDSEGRLLPADVTHTHPDPGPHQRYTVTSRVTVQKTDTNRFTCRVQLKGHNQTRDKEIRVPGEMFPKDRPEFGVSVGALAGAVVGTAVLCLCVGAFLGGLAVWMKYRKLITAMEGPLVNGTYLEPLEQNPPNGRNNVHNAGQVLNGDGVRPELGERRKQKTCDPHVGELNQVMNGDGVHVDHTRTVDQVCVTIH